MHIDVSSRSEQREFGLVMAAAFAAVGGLRWGWHWYRQGTLPAPPSLFLGIAAAFLVLGLAWPGALRPVLAAWIRLALGMNWVVTHAVLTLAFALLFTPVAYVRRLLGWDMRKGGANGAQDTFWEPAEEQPAGYDAYLNQF